MTHLVLKISEGGNPSPVKALRQVQFSERFPGVSRTTETLLLLSHSFSVNIRGQSPSEAFLKHAVLLGFIPSCCGFRHTLCRRVDPGA